MPLRYLRKTHAERFVDIVTNFEEIARNLYEQFGRDIVEIERDIADLVAGQMKIDDIVDFESRRSELDEELALRKRIRKEIDGAVVVPVSKEAAIEVYRDLCQHPAVKSVHVDSREIVVTISAQMAYRGHLYSTGKWQLHLAVESLDLYATILKSGRAENVSETKAYEYNGFCFGGNEEFLRDQLLRGNIGETLLAAVNYMSYVNASDEQNIPFVYKPIGVVP